MNSTDFLYVIKIYNYNLEKKINPWIKFYYEIIQVKTRLYVYNNFIANNTMIDHISVLIDSKQFKQSYKNSYAMVQFQVEF